MPSRCRFLDALHEVLHTRHPNWSGGACQKSGHSRKATTLPRENGGQARPLNGQHGIVELRQMRACKHAPYPSRSLTILRNCSWFTGLLM